MGYQSMSGNGNDNDRVKQEILDLDWGEEVVLNRSEVLPMYVRANINSVQSVSSVTQSFKIEMTLVLTAKTQNNSSLKEFLMKYEPRLTILNIIDGAEIEKESTTEHPGGDVTFRYHVRGEFGEKCELQNFPFDTQEAKVTLCLNDYVCTRFEDDVKRVEFDNKNISLPGKLKYLVLASDRTCQDSVIQRNAFQESDVWDLSRKIEMRPFLSHPGDSGFLKQYSELHVTLTMTRHPESYIYGIGVPLAFITTLGWGCSAISHEDFADRSAITLTLLLTSVAYKFVISQNIPPVSYLTFLDKYVLTSSIFLCSLFLQNYIAFWLDSSLLDDLMLCTLFGIWVCMNVWFIAFGIVVMKSRQRSKDRAFEISWKIE
mmetsp:Transcript_663/g.1034  ORF Transcript_663/g.1034 Transcript_663/m.1034 type:complete len:373 (-) Transcript_663:169-1287(-)